MADTSEEFLVGEIIGGGFQIAIIKVLSFLVDWFVGGGFTVEAFTVVGNGVCVVGQRRVAVAVSLHPFLSRGQHTHTQF